MTWRGTLLLCILAAAAAIMALRLHATAPERAASVARSLLGSDELPVEGVRSIRIERPDAADLRIERRGAAWIETSPFDVAVDPHRIREAILAARQLRWTRRLSRAELEREGTSAAALSLDPPLATITFGLVRDGKTHEVRLHLGRVGVAGRAFIRRGESDYVFVVGQELHRRILGEDLRAWRERWLFPDASVDTTKIVLRAGGVRTELVRAGRRWQLVEPIATRADPTMVAALLQALARAECDGFVAERPDDLRPFGLQPAAGEIAIRVRQPGVAEPVRRTLLIGAPVSPGASDRYAMIEGRSLVMRIGGATLQSMFAAPAALVEPTAADGRPADIREITAIVDQVITTVRRTPEGWSRLSRDDPPRAIAVMDVRWIEDLLDRLLETRATAVSMQDYPDALHYATIRLAGFDDEPPTELRIAIDRGAGQWASDAGDGVLRIFPLGLLPIMPFPDDTPRIGGPGAQP